MEEVTEEITKVTKRVDFELPNEIVQVNFVKRQRGSITNKKHILYGGMMEGSKRTFVPKRSRSTFKYEKILTKEEQVYLEPAMGLVKNGLNPYLSDDNFWDTIKVELLKEGIKLNLSDPIDYIRWKILLTYANTVAPTLAELKRQNKQTYMFVIVRDGEQENSKVESFNVKKEAYKIVDKVETSTERLKEFLYLMGVRVSPDTSITWIKSKLADLVELDPGKIVEVYNTDNYAVRGLIARAVLSGVIKEVNGLYHLEDGIALCGEGESPSLSNAVKFLAHNNNADIRNRVDAKLGK